MADADWDLGQKLIEQGACSLDQVREVLSLQDRMRKMGVIPKPFARVTVAYTTPTKVLAATSRAAAEEGPRFERLLNEAVEIADG